MEEQKQAEQQWNKIRRERINILKEAPSEENPLWQRRCGNRADASGGFCCFLQGSGSCLFFLVKKRISGLHCICCLCGEQ